MNFWSDAIFCYTENLRSSRPNGLAAYQILLAQCPNSLMQIIDKTNNANNAKLGIKLGILIKNYIR